MVVSAFFKRIRTHLDLMERSMMEEVEKARQDRVRDRDHQETELNNLLVNVSEKEFRVLSAELDLIG